MHNFLLPTTYYILHTKQGQAALSMIFLIGSIIVLVGVTLAILVFGFVNSALGFGTANQILAAASAGVNDALMQLIRNKDFSDTGGYAITIGGISVTVTVTQGVGQATIVSTAQQLTRRKSIRSVAVINQTTGQVFLKSWQELTL